MFENCRVDTSLHVYVDNDDPRLDEYRELVGVNLVVGEPSRIGPILNRNVMDLVDNYYIVGFMGDDHAPRTPGWDKVFLDHLTEMRTGVVYGNDLFQGQNLATAVCMTSDIIKTLGYFSLPGANHLFLDNFWMSIGRGIDRLYYFDDVVIEHIHPAKEKAEWDEVYANANSGETWAFDEAAYLKYLANQYSSDIVKLKTALGL
jgi:hypothetical protein